MVALASVELVEFGGGTSPREACSRLVLHQATHSTIAELELAAGAPDAVVGHLPLWVAGHTQAPDAIVGIIFVINCVAVALFSIRLASGSETPTAASHAALRSGVSLLAACALMAISGAGGAATAITLLVLAMLLQAVGEMQQAASQWGLSLGLARHDRQGQYEGAASTGLALALSVGPLVRAGVVSLGSAGWLILGLALLATGAATVPATRWALASRTAG